MDDEVPAPIRRVAEGRDQSTDGFAFVQQLTAPPSGLSPGAHLSAPEIVNILFLGWNGYLAAVAARSRDQEDGTWAQPFTRSVTVELLAEVMEGDALEVAVRAVSRRLRSFVLELSVRRTSDNRVVATGQTVQVCIAEAGSPGIPSSLWRAVEEIESRTIPRSG